MVGRHDCDVADLCILFVQQLQINYYYINFRQLFLITLKKLICIYDQLGMIQIYLIILLTTFKQQNYRQYKLENKRKMITFGINEQIYDICSTPAPINRKSTLHIKSCKSSISEQSHKIKNMDNKQQKYKKVYFQKIKQKFQDDQTNHQQQSKNQISSISQSTFSDFFLGGIKKNQILQSQIIKNFSQLKGVLDLQIGSFILKRIFKAGQHNFEVRKFHQLCGHIQNTVVIAQINNGNIVGGYTPLAWNDKYHLAKTHYKTDKQSKSFIFNFTSKQKYPLIKQTSNKAIVGCQYLGPTFGGGYDFSIGNFANKKYSSSCDFPTSYSKDIGIKNLKLNRRSLIGISQQLFLIKQWEVFQVCIKKQNTNESTPAQEKNINLDSEKKQKQNLIIPNDGFFKNLVSYFGGSQRKNDDQI